MMVNPSLVILDGTMSMMTNGPTGGSLSDLKQTDTMIVATDQVAADAFGATLLDRRSTICHLSAWPKPPVLELPTIVRWIRWNCQSSAESKV
jgi:uncharacterized protein (DUF362 family)